MATIESLLWQMHDAWDTPGLLGEIGRELHDRNRLAHARAALERVVDANPFDVESWAHLAYCCLRSLVPAADEGREVLRRGIEKTHDVRLIGTLSHFTDDDDERRRLKEALEQSDEAAAKASLLAHDAWGDEPQEAFRAMLENLAAHPGDLSALEQTCWSLLGLRGRGVIDGLDLRIAGVPLADRLIELRGGSLGPWLKIQMLLAEKDWDAVLAATEQALDISPDDETMMQFRARAFREKGDGEAAVHWFSRAIGAKPSFVGARVELGRLYEARGDVVLAEQLFRELGVANPDWPLAPISLSLFLARQERFDEAERLFLAAWPRLPEGLQKDLLTNPDAKVLLKREAVRSVVA